MRIKFGETIILLNKLNDEEKIISPLTKKELHNFCHSISVKGIRKESFEKVIEECKCGGIFEIDENEQAIRNYKVHIKSSSYSGHNTDENTVYNYYVSFEEVDELLIESLNIGTLNIKPYKYEEEYDEAIIISASVKLSKEEMVELKKIQDGERYFDVVRVGINNEAVKMRFGQNIWSEHDEYFKVNLVLVESCYDTKETGHGLNEPEMSNIKRKLIHLNNFNNELVELLLIKEIITKDEVESIKKKADEKFKDGYRDLYKVEDVDKF